MNSEPGNLSIFALGGLGEIGKNMWVVEAGGDILVLDAGVMFPEEEMLGIDLVIPDITYLRERRDRVRAIVVTHGHEDHIGALPFVLRELEVPVYGTRLTLGLIRARLSEHAVPERDLLQEVRAGDVVRIGCFSVEFVHVNHSIADVVALAIDTPAGRVLYATDFKVDHTPIDGRAIDLPRLTELGSEGVAVLLSDSTNAERPGYTLSERVVGETLLDTFRAARGRILVATFASNVHRIQQVIDAAAAFGRKLCVTGRSMVNVVRIATELGYLQVPEGMRIDIEDLGRYRPDELVVVTTGSQGEPMSALSRMAMGEHRQLEIVPGDTVIISAHPIPGNERLIGRTINHLFKLGAKVIYHAFSGVHVSGHASQEELKLMLSLTRPRYFVPIHGEYRMLIRHVELARSLGIPDERIFVMDLGDVLDVSPAGAERSRRVPAGQVLVDGLGVGDVGNVVLRDRRQLSQDGILIAVLTVSKENGQVLAGPDIVSRGFVYVRESEALLEEARERIQQAIGECLRRNVTEWGNIKGQIREAVSSHLYERTKRRPMILPIVMEV